MKVKSIINICLRSGLIVLPFIGFIQAYGQQGITYPSVLGPAGTISVHQGISFEWTLGETFVESKVLNKNWYTEGYHQPLLIVQPIAVNPGISKDRISIFPNPTLGLINVSFEMNNPSSLNIRISDVAGRSILESPVAEGTKELKLKLDYLPQGMYIMTILDLQGYRLRSFKVIKK